jgi:hypothetical protein
MGLHSASGLIIGSCWLVFLAVWAVGALTASAAKRVEPIASRLLHVSLVSLGGLLVTPWAAGIPGNHPLVPDIAAKDLAGVAVTAVGVAFAVWARLFLGRNWSGRITLKEGHQLIQSGPYRFARHPIYTGITTAILGSAVWEGRPGGFVAVACFLFGFGWKIRVEERWLTEAFGDAYRVYKQRVKALIPFVV